MSGRGAPQQGTGTTYRAAIRTATALSVVAVLASLVLRSVTDVPQTALVLAVIVVGFIASLVVTEREARAETRTTHRGHRVTVLPAVHRVA